MGYIAQLRVAEGSAPKGKAQWLSEEGETLEELKARMKKDGSDPGLYNFVQV